MTDSKIVTTGSTSEIRAAFYKSGFFTDVKNEAQAIVKIQAGDELGLGPFASMQGINIVQGKLNISSGTQAALIKKTGKYNWKVLEHTDKACELEFYEKWGNDWVAIGKSRFTWEEAVKAKLTTKQVWTQYPKNMLFARALSNAAKWYCPDAFSGSVYNEADDFSSVPVAETDNSQVEALKAQLETVEPVVVASEASVPTNSMATQVAAVKDTFSGSKLLVSDVVDSFNACTTLEELIESKDLVKQYLAEFEASDQEKVKEAYKKKQKELKSE